MALILSIDTSTKVCSVALHQDTLLLGVFEMFTEKSHSSAITILIENIVQQCGFELKDLSAVAIAKGPGSYTGLRIGTATAKGLCFALDKPLIAINTLASMAYGLSRQMPFPHILFCPMIDARRMEVYCAIYNHTQEILLPVDARIIQQDSFSQLIARHKIVFFGDGASKCKNVLNYSDNALFIENFHPSAAYVGALALGKFNENIFEDIAYFEPFYLKEFFYKKAN
jgi:tRNA threonylcarbamoyladenosine biosynthesis protein TsaB